MKENKGKGLANEETMQKTYSKPHPAAVDKRKTLSKTIDLGNLPSHRINKKAKQGSSKSEVVKPGFVVSPAFKQPFVQMLDLDSSILTGATLS